MASYYIPKSSPSKRRKQGDIRFISGNDEVFGELLQGGLEVWSVERGMCDDGFTFDFGLSLEEGQFGQDNQVICWTKRRTSKANNTPALNPSNGYARMVLVRAVTLSTNDSRLKFADRFVQVRDVHPCHNTCPYSASHLHRSQELNATRKDRGWKAKPFVKAAKFDRTPPTAFALNKVDQFVQDHMVIEIINSIYGNASDVWAMDNPDDAGCFFSRPYPEIAIQTLGYPLGSTTNLMQSPIQPSQNSATPAATVSWDYDPDERSDTSSQGTEASNVPNSGGS